jgi:hypothetical protein
MSVSYNILATRIVTGEIFIDRHDAEFALENYEDALPESCFLYDIFDMPCVDGMTSIQSFEWHGECSGATLDTLKEKIVPLIHGNAQLLFVWEDGCLSGLVINEGTYNDCDVEVILKKCTS